MDAQCRQALVRMQAWSRGILARRAVDAYVDVLYARYYDEASGQDYYVNLVTWESRWEKPRLLRGRSLPYYMDGPAEEHPGEHGGEGRRRGEVQGGDGGVGTFEEVDAADLVLDEPGPAPMPNTVTAIRRAWHTFMPEHSNPAGATLVRVDVYSSKRPQRCLVLQGVSLLEALAERTLSDTIDEWELHLSFFAYDAPVPNASAYSVWHAERPFRSKLCVRPRGGGDSDDDPDDEDGGEGKHMEQAGTATTGRIGRSWTRASRFWAYYAPVQNAIRINVQQVPNPVRFRVTEEGGQRGGWSQQFCFFAYPVVRFAVLDAVGCGPKLARGKLREFPYAEQPVLHPRVTGVEAEHPEDLSNTLWCRRFEFVGLKCRFPGALEYVVLCRYEALRANDATLYPVYKLMQEDSGDSKDWTELAHFFAFPMPMPRTTRYYFLVARKPTRFRVALTEFVGGGWRTLFDFYAYSTRSQDWYPLPGELLAPGDAHGHLRL